MNPILAVTTPEFLDEFSDLGPMISWLENFGLTIGAVLVAAAAIYLAFVGYRKFRLSVNKV